MVEQLVERTVPRRPTGPRAAAREDAILKAALALVLEVGYDKMSIDAVAERAHAGKATIYRHFPDKAALVASAIARDEAAASEPLDAGSLRADLLAFGTSAVRAAGPDGGIFAGLLNASRTDEVFAGLLSERMSESKRHSLGVIVERAVARGELMDTSRVSLVCEVACSVVLHRLFVERARPDEEFRRHLVDEIVIPLLTYRPAERAARTRSRAAHPAPSAAAAPIRTRGQGRMP